eukprot:9429632-Alexandrium_andersonii.AAC.1
MASPRWLLDHTERPIEALKSNVSFHRSSASYPQDRSNKSVQTRFTNDADCRLLACVGGGKTLSTVR